MYNRTAEPRDYTRVIEALPDKLDIKRHSPGILYLSGKCNFEMCMKESDKWQLFKHLFFPKVVCIPVIT